MEWTWLRKVVTVAAVVHGITRVGFKYMAAVMIRRALLDVIPYPIPPPDDYHEVIFMDGLTLHDQVIIVAVLSLFFSLSGTFMDSYGRLLGPLESNRIRRAMLRNVLSIRSDGLHDVSESDLRGMFERELGLITSFFSNAYAYVVEDVSTILVALVAVFVIAWDIGLIVIGMFTLLFVTEAVVDRLVLDKLGKVTAAVDTRLGAEVQNLISMRDLVICCCSQKIEVERVGSIEEEQERVARRVCRFGLPVAFSRLMLLGWCPTILILFGAEARSNLEDITAVLFVLIVSDELIKGMLTLLVRLPMVTSAETAWQSLRRWTVEESTAAEEAGATTPRDGGSTEGDASGREKDVTHSRVVGEDGDAAHSPGSSVDDMVIVDKAPGGKASNVDPFVGPGETIAVEMQTVDTYRDPATSPFRARHRAGSRGLQNSSTGGQRSPLSRTSSKMAPKFFRSTSSFASVVDRMSPLRRRSGVKSMHPLPPALFFKESITMQEATLGYIDKATGEYTIVQENFSLSLKRGEKVVLVGESGAGKSTILRTFAGLLIPSKGGLRVDDTRVTPSNYDSYRGLVGVFFQDSTLFQRSIRDNISYGGTREPSDMNVMEACRLAHLDEFVKELPAGLDTLLVDCEKQLSGGQRQRVQLARLFFNDSVEFVVLDEPTSALDPKTAKVVAEHLRIFLKDKTALVVTHQHDLIPLFGNTTHLVTRCQGKS